jgi:hypothetical protein
MWNVVIIIAIVLAVVLLGFVGYDAIHGTGPGSAMDSLSDFLGGVVTTVMENKGWSIVIVVGFVAALFTFNRVKTGRR